MSEVSAMRTRISCGQINAPEDVDLFLQDIAKIREKN